MSPATTPAQTTSQENLQAPPQFPITTPAQSAPSEKGSGRGQRLTAAFEALEEFPALAESRDQTIELMEGNNSATGELVAAIEADVALVVALLRTANKTKRGDNQVESVVEALEVIPIPDVRSRFESIPTFDFLQRTGAWQGVAERFRLHALSTQRAADGLAREISYPYRDRLMVTSLLHDIGKLALMYAYSGYPRQVHGNARTPEERIVAERRSLGVDHALVGGVLARRWGLPKSISSAIERHHSDDQTGDAALVQLADMLSHYAQGGPTAPGKLLAQARIVGIGPAELRHVMFELPGAPSTRQRTLDPCPLSTREVEVLKRLGEGKVYKQIAQELSLSTSTVRTHLHNIYGKLGAVDRAQAVLLANARGWI